MQEISEQTSYGQSTVLRPMSVDALDPKERSCCICFQPFRPTASSQGGSEVPAQLPCGHVFGELCVLSWTLTNNSCPLCRKGVFGIDDRHAYQHFSNFSNSNSLRSPFTPQDDIWLDEYVWNLSPGCREQDEVSFAEFETLIEFCTRERSTVALDPQHRMSPEELRCAEHRGSCHFTIEENTRNAAVPHRRLTPPPTISHDTYAATIDLAGTGSQFAELTSCYGQWMYEFLNDPDHGGDFFV